MTRLKLYFIALSISTFSAFQANGQQKNVAAQFSVMPGLSTNGDSAKTMTNNVSFSLFAGVNGGVKGFELGTIANILNNDLQGMQIAGITNIVHGKADAMQIAGIFNYNKMNFSGMQISGIASIADSNFMGMQISGIAGYTQNVDGAQISGLSSTAKNVNGMQIGGLGSVANNLVGLQVSGIISNAKSVTGLQVAGLVNHTSVLTGVQIGFINVSDKVKGGVPIGFISYSKNGYRTIDASYNEIFPATLQFKTGVNQFYNIFTASSNFDSETHLWSVGYGFGSRFHITNGTLLEFDATVSQLSQNQFEEEWNLLGRFNMNFAVQLGGICEIYAGPSLNIYATQVYNADTETFGHNIAPASVFYEEVVYDFDKPTFLQGWIGAQVGIRL